MGTIPRVDGDCPALTLGPIGQQDRPQALLRFAWEGQAAAMHVKPASKQGTKGKQFTANVCLFVARQSLCWHELSPFLAPPPVAAAAQS